MFGLPSALFEKFLLKECIIEFFSCLSAPFLSHCPIHGPQAFVKIFAFNFSKIERIPSLSAVYLTCSDPGFIPNSALVTSFFSRACFAIEADLVRSSYDELVHDPINPHSMSTGHFSY